MSSLVSSARKVVVECPGCGNRREVTVRQARRAGRCGLCRSGTLKKEPTVADLRFWLRAMTDEQLAQLLSDLRGEPYLAERVAQVRLALLGEGDARPARLLSSVPQQAGLIA